MAPWAKCKYTHILKVCWQYVWGNCPSSSLCNRLTEVETWQKLYVIWWQLLPSSFRLHTYTTWKHAQHRKWVHQLAGQQQFHNCLCIRQLLYASYQLQCSPCYRTLCQEITPVIWLPKSSAIYRSHKLVQIILLMRDYTSSVTAPAWQKRRSHRGGVNHCTFSLYNQRSLSSLIQHTNHLIKSIQCHLTRVSECLSKSLILSCTEYNTHRLHLLMNWNVHPPNNDGGDAKVATSYHWSQISHDTLEICTSLEEREVLRLCCVKHHVYLCGVCIIIGSPELASMPHHTQEYLRHTTPIIAMMPFDKKFESIPAAATLRTPWSWQEIAVAIRPRHSECRLLLVWQNFG